MDDTRRLDEQLQQLHLHYIRSHYQEQANKAAEQQHPHVHYLAQLIEGEATTQENRAIHRRIDNAHFPVLKTLDTFQWSWPKKINRQQIQNLFRLAFISTQTNVVFIGNVGLGKTHLSIALGYTACLKGHSYCLPRLWTSSIRQLASPHRPSILTITVTRFRERTRAQPQSRPSSMLGHQPAFVICLASVRLQLVGCDFNFRSPDTR
jgi:DNA replication protein DnaC